MVFMLDLPLATGQSATGDPEPQQMSLSVGDTILIDVTLPADQNLPSTMNTGDQIHQVEQPLPLRVRRSPRFNNGPLPDAIIYDGIIYNEVRESSVPGQSPPAYDAASSPSIAEEDHLDGIPTTPRDAFDDRYSRNYKYDQAPYYDMMEVPDGLIHSLYGVDPLESMRTIFPTHLTTYPTHQRYGQRRRNSPSPIQIRSHVRRRARRTASASPIRKRRSSSKFGRPYRCLFDFAGCKTTFDTKNEWKRHVLSQHVCFNYWICQEGVCATTRGSGGQHRSHLLPSFGSIFNRKDLFTQHVRRMHPEAIGHDANSLEPPSQESCDVLRQMQAAAVRERVKLPDMLNCPLDECNHVFEGSSAWNSRMEHISQHFEANSPHFKPTIQFGGPTDALFIEWASREDIGVIKKNGNRWRLCDLLRGDNKPNFMMMMANANHEMVDEDAEGEFI